MCVCVRSVGSDGEKKRTRMIAFFAPSSTFYPLNESEVYKRMCVRVMCVCVIDRRSIEEREERREREEERERNGGSTFLQPFPSDAVLHVKRWNAGVHCVCLNRTRERERERKKKRWRSEASDVSLSLSLLSRFSSGFIALRLNHTTPHHTTPHHTTPHHSLHTVTCLPFSKKERERKNRYKVLLFPSTTSTLVSPSLSTHPRPNGRPLQSP